MAGPYDLTGQNIENTYQRVIQTPDGTTFYDGTGSLVNIGAGGVTKIIAGSGVTISPSTGLGDVTINSTAATYNTATGSYGSFYDTGSQTAVSTTTIYSMSLSTTDISNGVYVSGSDRTRIYVTNAGVYNLQFSAQFSNTSNNDPQDVAVWLRKNDGSSANDIVDSNSFVTVPGAKGGDPGQIIAAWNFFLQLAAGDFVQLLWHAEKANVITLETIIAGTSPTHPRTPSLIATAQRVDTFLSNTGSFSGSFTGQLIGTASWANNAVTASYFQTFPYTGSAIITGSLILTGSLTTNDGLSTQTITSSFISASGGITGSLFGTSSWAQSASVSISSSYALSSSISTTSSYALTASYTPNALVTASVSTNTITFIKGDGSTFPITIDTGSGGSSIGPGATNTLALWDSTSTITSSSITYLTGTDATDQATVGNTLYNANIDGVKIGSTSDITQISSSVNSNIFVNNISPAGNRIVIPNQTSSVIKYLDLYKYNITDKSGCYGMILDFNIMLSNRSLSGDQVEFVYDNTAWPNLDTPYYVETGRIYLSWLGADKDIGGAVGKGNVVTYLTMNRTITNAISNGWDEVDNTTSPSKTALAASEEGVVAPYLAPVFRDQNAGYQFGYKLVNNPGTSEWYIEIAIFNDTTTKLYITHTTKLLTLFTNP